MVSETVRYNEKYTCIQLLISFMHEDPIVRYQFILTG